MQDDSVIFLRWSEALKFICSFQCYVQRTHHASGLLERFPDVIVHPFTCGRMGVEAAPVAEYMVADFHLYAYGKTTDVELYVNMYVDRLTSAVLLRGGPLVKFDPYTAGQNWRKYMDNVISELKRALDRENR